MTDDELSPTANPFDTIGESAPEGLPAPAQDQNIFDQIGPQVAEATTAKGAFGHAAARGVLPTLASFPAMGAGAELGALAGAPLGPVGAIGGGILGALAGGFLGATAMSTAQDWALSKLPDDFTESIGQDPKTRALEEKQHGMASFLGGLLPFALTMRPSAAPLFALPENATAFQRIMASPATSRIFGGSIMGGMELGNELVHEGTPDWAKVGIATGFGVVLNRQTKLGDRLTEVGARPTRAAIGRPEPGIETPAGVETPAPTVAEAADAKVMGPGVTESVFMGTHVQADQAAMVAQETARVEQSFLGRKIEPDLHVRAREIEPEVFTAYDELLARRETFREWVAEAERDGLDAPSARQHLAAVESELREIAPEISSSYRRISEMHGIEPIETAPALAPAGDGVAAGVPVEQQRTFIANDVAQQLMAAGRPEAEALAAGQLVAARYETRAARFGGELGTAQELYAREGAQIMGPGMPQRPRAQQPTAERPVPRTKEELADYIAKGGEVEAGPIIDKVMSTAKRGPAARDEKTFSLFEYLASRGGLRPDPELTVIFGGTNPFIPGFGRLIRKNGMKLDEARQNASLDRYLAGEASGGEGSRIDDLLTAMDTESRGTRQYRWGEEGRAQVEKPDYLFEKLEGELSVALQEVGTDINKIPKPLRDRTLEIMHREGGDPHEAWERAVMEEDRRGVDRGEAKPFDEEIPGWDVPDDGGAAPQARGADQGSEPGTGRAARDAGERNREAVEQPVDEFFQHSRVTDTPEFKEWWRASKITDDNGAPAVMYRGDFRPIGPKFKKNASTSARFYFTSDPQIAGGYAEGKPYIPEGALDYENWFKFPPAKGARTPTNLVRQWYNLTPEQKANVEDTMLRAHFTDEVDAKLVIDDSRTGGIASPDHWQREVRDARGNWLQAAKEVWLNSGALFGDEEKFAQILRHAGLKDVAFDNPHEGHPSITPVYLSIQNPVSTREITQAFIDRIAAEIKGDRTRAKQNLANWDKEGVTPREWLRNLQEDYAAKGGDVADLTDSHVWTAMPENITKALQRMGFDGVDDRGGKAAGPAGVLSPGQDRHRVVIAFEPEQIKSVNNRGTFDPNDPRILYQQDQAPTFYSAVSKAIDGIPQEKASGAQWLATLRNRPGVKPEEMEWLGLEPWLKEQKGSVTKEQIADYVRANQIELKEVTKGKGLGGPELTPASPRWDPDRFQRETDTKFSDYQLPGGENYREMLLTLPPKSGPEGNAVATFAKEMREQYGERWTAEAPESVRQRYDELIEAQDRAPVQPETQNFRSSHWDEPNVLAHIRFNDRTINGKKTLFIEEVQSDWHQKGRTSGYDTPDAKAADAPLHARLDELNKSRDAIKEKMDPLEANQEKERQKAIKRLQKSDPDLMGGFDRQAQFAAIKSEMEKSKVGREYADLAAQWHSLTREINQTKEKLAPSNKVPDAPFKTSWPELSMKRMIRYAAENGYDQIAWTPGDVQAARYDLSKHLDRIEYERVIGDDGKPTGKYEIYAKDKNGKEVFHEDEVDLKRVEEIAGKEIAKKIENNEGSKENSEHKSAYRDWHALTDLDLKVGGEGMRGFYDEILPKTVNKLVKKYGAKVGREEMFPEGSMEKLPVDAMTKDGALPVHKVEITPELSEVATEQGFPLFQGARGKIRLAEGRKPIITLMKDANASTFIHESGHQWLEELVRDAAHPKAPNLVRDDADTVIKWLGAHSAEDIKRRHHEKFARGFEQYLREGVAPSPELAGVFARFKDWLLKIYETIKGLGAPINEDIRQVFDRMLSVEPQRTVVAPERAGQPTIHDIHADDARHIEPAEAGPAADRIAAETARTIEELPPEVRRELETAEAEIHPTPDAGAKPAGEAGAGPAASGQVERGGEPSGAVPEGSGGGAQSGAVSESRGGTAAKGTVSPRGRSESGADQLAPQPATLFGPRESPFTDRAGNIRIENLTTREDVAQAIRDAAEANNDFIGDRRGVVTDGQVMDLADALGMDFDMLMTRRIGQAFNAEQVIAARKLLIQSATDVSAAMKKAANGTDADVMAYAQAKDRHQLIQGQVAGLTAEAGRALRAFRNIAGQEGAVQVDQFLRSATGKTLFQLKQEAKLGAALDTPQAVSKFMADAQKRNAGHMLLEYWINGLLSGPSTHATNMIGNTILTIQHSGPETAAAALIGAARKAMGREGQVVRIGELGARLKGLAEGLPGAIKGAAQSAKAGTNMLLPGEEARALPFQSGNEHAPRPIWDEHATYSSVMADTFGAVQGMQDGLVALGQLVKAGGVEGSPLISTRYSMTGAIPDIEVRGINALPIGTLARLPGRFLSAADAFFRAVNYSMAKNAQAYRTAMDEGKTGTAFDARVAELRQSPSEAMMAESVAEASKLTFMDKGGKFLAALSHLASVEVGGFPMLKFISPFVHVAGTIMKQTVMQRMPFGVLSSEIRADLMGKNGTVAQDYAQARMLVGTAISVGVGTLAAQGYASGSGPTDPKEAMIWRMAGNQAHSIRIGDMWYQTHKLGPLGMLTSIAADLYGVAHTAQTGDMEEASAKLIFAFSQNILDQSMLKGPSDLMRAVNDSDRYGSQYIRNFLSGFVPYSVGMSQFDKMGDPTSREARTVVDAIRAKIPGHMASWFGSDLFPKRDIWGEPMMKPDTLGGPGVTGIVQKAMSTDPVNLALNELGIFPGQVQRKIRNVDLTDQQFDDFTRTAGRMTKQRLDAVVRAPDYQTWPSHIRALVITEVIRQSREAARGMMLMQYPDIVKQATMDKLEKVRGPQQ